jgi:hypothetical protein
MTANTPIAQRDTSQTGAYRIAALLLGVGTVHFLAPKQFDDIIPAELPGSPRLYTYASGVAEVVIGALLLVPRTRRSAAHRRFGPAAAADSDDHRGAQGPAQRLTRRLG